MELGPAELSLNARQHYHKKGRETKLYRRYAWGLARERAQQLGITAPLPTPVEAVVIFVVPTRARRDFDNLMSRLKPAWDGFVDAGVLSDDNAWVLKPKLDIELGAKGPPPVTLVRITLTGAPQVQLL